MSRTFQLLYWTTLETSEGHLGPHDEGIRPSRIASACILSQCCVPPGAKSGRLESLSGTSKQSHSSSSKLRLTADSSNHLAASSHLQHIDSDADSHPGRATSKSKPSDSDKCSPFAERQRTSDLSSRDVLDATEESRPKDEMQSEPVSTVR